MIQLGLHRIDRSDTIHRRINGISCIGQQSGKHVAESFLIVNHEHRDIFFCHGAVEVGDGRNGMSIPADTITRIIATIIS